MKNKKIYFDIALNIGASGVPIAVLQLIIYPLLSRQMDASTYGTMIALYALVILIDDSLGKSINNIRLVRYDEEVSRTGTYNIILTIYSFVGIVSTGIGIIYYSEQGPITAFQVLIWIVVSGLYVINGYLIVYFRLRLNFLAIFLNSVVLSAGFVVGFFVYEVTSNWAFIFLIAHAFEFFYLIIVTDLLREPYKRADGFRLILTDCTLLAISMLLGQGMIQADKLLLLPMLGGEMVAIYYTATITGKVVSLAMGPINSVILSYIAGKESLSKNEFRKYFLLCVVACAIISIAMLLVSRPVLGFLFPYYVDGAMQIIVFTTINVFLYTLAGLMTPIIMKYCDIYWQIVINGVGVVFYITLALIFLSLFGIIGFCIGIGISHFIRLVMMILIYNRKVEMVSERKDMK